MSILRTIWRAITSFFSQCRMLPFYSETNKHLYFMRIYIKTLDNKTDQDLILYMKEDERTPENMMMLALFEYLSSLDPYDMNAKENSSQRTMEKYRFAKMLIPIWLTYKRQKDDGEISIRKNAHSYLAYVQASGGSHLQGVP